MNLPLFRKRLTSFLKYYRPHRGLLLIDMGAAVSQSALTVVLPLVVYQVFHVYLPEMALGKIVGAAVALLVLALAIALADYAGIRWGHMLGVRIEADMRRDLFGHLQKLSFSYFDRTQTGQIMSRISNDLTQIAEIAHHCPEDILIAVLTMGGAFAMMAYLNPLLTLITLIPLPFILLWGAVFQGRMHRGFREVRRKVGELNSRVENSIQGIREVRSYCNEGPEIQRFAEVNNRFKKARENVFGVMAGFHSGMMFLVQSYSLLFIAAGALLMYYGKATLAEVLVFTMYARYFTMPIFRLVSFIEQFQQGATAFERFAEVLDEAPEIRDAAVSVRPEKLAGTIVFDQVSFRYQGMAPNSVPVLDQVSLEIPAGQMVALVGESGAGKTTLAALISRFYDATQGRITIDGIDVRELPQDFLRSQVGVVRQTPFLFDTTIGENIRFGRPGATEAEMIAAAREANIWDFIRELPDVFNTAVGEHGVKLSGGQRQRISLARIFLKNPKILIFDEATSALDNESEALVQEAMKRLCAGRTTVVIAHRLSTVRDVDFIYCMRGGRIVEAGTHHELIAADGYYRKLYSIHSF